MLTDQGQALLEQSLDEYIEGDAWPQPLPEDPERPVPVTDPELAERILARVHRMQLEGQTIEATYRRRLERMDAWRDDMLSGILRDIRWGNQALEAFTRNHAQVLGKESGHVLRTPDGVLKLNPVGKGSVVVTDAVAVAAYVDANGLDANLEGPEGEAPLPPIIKRKPEVSATAVGQRLTQSPDPLAETVDDDGVTWKVYGFYSPMGELVPGVERHVRAVPTFGIEVAK